MFKELILKVISIEGLHANYGQHTQNHSKIMISHYEQHLMTAKLLGGKGVVASVITILVPCSALPRAAGQALVAIPSLACLCFCP